MSRSWTCSSATRRRSPHAAMPGGAVVTPAQPGSLTASRITTWPGGIVAEIVIDEQAGAFGRWSQGGSWSAWWPIADGVRDASLAAADGTERSPRPW